MYIYSWILYIFLACLSVVLIRRSCLNKPTVLVYGNKLSFSINTSMAFLFLILLFFAVMRKIEPGVGGTDAYEYLQKIDSANISYSSYLDALRTKSLLKTGEPLFQLFIILCNKLPHSHAVFLLVVYSTIIYCFLRFIRKFYDKTLNLFPILLLICYFLSSFNILRSWLSVALCLISFNLIADKKYIKSIVLILIASLIHYVGFCFLLVWLCCFLYDKKPRLFSRRSLLIFCVGINVLTFVCQSVLINFFTDTKYSSYMGLLNTVSIIGHIPTILICFYSVWLFDKYKDIDENIAKCIIAITINLSLMYTIIFLLGWRINDFFALIRMYMLSVFFYDFKRKKYGTIYSVLLYLFIVVIFIQQMLSLRASSGVFPYLLSFM